MERKRLLLLCLLLTVTLVTACSPASPGGETHQVTLSASETFTSADGSFTFQAPAGWFMLNFPNDTAILATKQELLNNPGVIPVGECELVIGPIKASTLEGLRKNPLYNQIVKNDPPTTGELLDLLLAQMNISSATDNQAQKIGDKQTLLATFTQTLGDQKSNGSLMILESAPNAYIFVQTVAAEGNLENCQAAANQVAESAQYQP